MLHKSATPHSPVISFSYTILTFGILLSSNHWDLQYLHSSATPTTCFPDSSRTLPTLAACIIFRVVCTTASKFHIADRNLSWMSHTSKIVFFASIIALRHNVNEVKKNVSDEHSQGAERGSSANRPAGFSNSPSQSQTPSNACANWLQRSVLCREVGQILGYSKDAFYVGDQEHFSLSKRIILLDLLEGRIDMLDLFSRRRISRQLTCQRYSALLPVGLT